jgi:hypothetical protein
LSETLIVFKQCPSESCTNFLSCAISYPTWSGSMEKSSVTANRKLD